MKLGGGILAGAAGEDVGNLIVDGKEPLHLPWRPEAFHDPLPSPRGLMRILCSVVQALVLAVLDARHDLPLGRGIAFQLVGDGVVQRRVTAGAELTLPGRVTAP